MLGNYHPWSKGLSKETDEKLRDMAKKLSDKNRIYKDLSNLPSKEYGKIRNLRFREEAIKILGGKCIRCRESDIRVLQIDHVNGGGTKERKLNHNYSKKLILKNPDNYQLLCSNCNWIKRVENNEHKKYTGNNIKPKDREIHKKLRIEVINFLGGKCTICGNTDIRCLQIDHINGGGWNDHLKGKTGTIYGYSNILKVSIPKKYKEIMKEFGINSHPENTKMNKDYPNKLQLLCANCNWIKKAENGEVAYRNISEK